MQSRTRARHSVDPVLEVSDFKNIPQGSKPSKPSKCRGEPKPIDPEALVNAQNWFEDGLGYTALAKDVRLGLVNIWELRSTIELVDILLWPAVKASKGMKQLCLHTEPATIALWNCEMPESYELQLDPLMCPAKYKVGRRPNYLIEEDVILWPVAGLGSAILRPFISE